MWRISSATPLLYPLPFSYSFKKYFNHLNDSNGWRAFMCPVNSWTEITLGRMRLKFKTLSCLPIIVIHKTHLLSTPTFNPNKRRQLWDRCCVVAAIFSWLLYLFLSFIIGVLPKCLWDTLNDVTDFFFFCILACCLYVYWIKQVLFRAEYCFISILECISLIIWSK